MRARNRKVPAVNEDIGELGLDGFEGWLYPKYIEAQCPGLPDWQAFEAAVARGTPLEMMFWGIERILNPLGAWEPRPSGLTLPLTYYPVPDSAISPALR